jgi:hypothetical protein
MSWRLRRRGFRCHALDVALEGVPDPPYGVIACLNVIDRARRPLSLLEQLRAGLADGGHLLLSVPLPYAPLYYDGASTRDPEQKLDIAGGTWEEAATALAHRVLQPLGFELRALARAPYLSGGDSEEPVYELDAAVVVCRRASP